MNENNDNNRMVEVKDFSGVMITLTLVKKEEYKDKKYDLYTVCKVIGKEKIALYDETFTDEQVEIFYTNPRLHFSK